MVRAGTVGSNTLQALATPPDGNVMERSSSACSSTEAGPGKYARVKFCHLQIRQLRPWQQQHSCPLGLRLKDNFSSTI